MLKIKLLAILIILSCLGCDNCEHIPDPLPVDQFIKMIQECKDADMFPRVITHKKMIVWVNCFEEEADLNPHNGCQHTKGKNTHDH